MAEQTRQWPIELVAASVGVLLSAALLAVAVSISLGTNPGTAPLAGTRLVTILSGSAAASTSTSKAAQGALTAADVDSIARAVPDVPVLSRIVSGAGAGASVLLDGDPQAQIQGVDPSYAQLWSRAVAGGYFFSARDAVAADRVAVLGSTVAARLFPNGQSPIGQTIRIRSEPFTVLGVLASHLVPVADDPDNTVLVPFQTAQVRLFGTRSVYQLVLQVRDVTQADSVTTQVQQVLRQRHKVGPGQTDDFTVLSQSNATVTATGPLQSLLDVGRQVQQFGCLAKGLCRATQ